MASVSHANRSYPGLVANSLVGCSGWVIITFLTTLIVSSVNKDSVYEYFMLVILTYLLMKLNVYAEIS